MQVVQFTTYKQYQQATSSGKKLKCEGVIADGNRDETTTKNRAFRHLFYVMVKYYFIDVDFFVCLCVCFEPISLALHCNASAQCVEKSVPMQFREGRQCGGGGGVTIK